MRARTVFALLLLAPLLAVGVSGCGGTASSQDPALLESTEWRVQELRGAKGEMEPALDLSPVTAKFADGRIAGNSGVNAYSATYEASEDGEMTLGDIQSTLMAGDESLMRRETQYTALLGKVASYEVTEVSLKLLDSDGETLIAYVPYKATTFEGTSWYCIAYNNGTGAVESVAAGSEITAVFGEDGSLTGSSGVNTYSGTYTAEERTLAIDPAIVTTKMAGPEPLMQQEQKYLAALPKATRYEVSGDSLLLLGGEDNQTRIAEYRGTKQ